MRNFRLTIADSWVSEEYIMEILSEEEWEDKL